MRNFYQVVAEQAWVAENELANENDRLLTSKLQDEARIASYRDSISRARGHLLKGNTELAAYTLEAAEHLAHGKANRVGEDLV